MSAIIDADSHWTTEWEFQLHRSPLKRYAQFLPPEDDQFIFFTAEDLMRSLPPEERPSPASLFPQHARPNGDLTRVPDFFEGVRKASTPAERLAWMDKIGIEYSIVNGGGFPALFPVIEDLDIRRQYLRDVNDVLADEMADSKGRFAPVTYVDLSDVDWAVGELTRMRARGSRAFSLRAEPVGGRSLAHPHFDRVWSTVADLGMIISVHVGLAPANFGDWGRMGLDYTTEEGVSLFLRMANSQKYQAAEYLLSAFLFGGVFARHPKLTVLIAELNAFWLPSVMQRLIIGSYPSMLGPWPYAKSGAEYLSEQVRVSPLPGLGDSTSLEVLRVAPEMVVFSSDYPHAEGNGDPISLYADGLKDLDPAVKAKFLGGTMISAFERMGDPLPV